MGWSENGGIPALITKMEGLSYYPAEFEFILGGEAITKERMERALAHLQRAMDALRRCGRLSISSNASG